MLEFASSLQLTFTVMKAIGRGFSWLSELRQKPQLSLIELAKETGFNKGYIEDMLKLTRLEPTLLERALNGALQVTLKELIAICKNYSWAQ